MTLNFRPGQLQRGDDARGQREDVRRGERGRHGDHLVGVQQLARGHALAQPGGDRQAQGGPRRLQCSKVRY